MAGRRGSRRGGALVLGAAVLALAWGPLAARPATASREEPILAYLDQTVAFYRQQVAQAELADEPSDVVFANAARQQAREVLRLAFTFARADAALRPAPERSGARVPAAPGQLDPTAIAGMASSAAAHVARAQAEVQALARRAAAAAGRQRAVLQAQLAEARSALQLAQARHDALASFAGFVTQAQTGGGQGLVARIDELQRSIPEAAGDDVPQPPPPAAAAAGAVARRAAPSGLVALGTELVALGRKLAQLRDGASLTAALRASADELRAPLLAELKSTLEAGQQLSGEPATSDRAVLRRRTRALDEATARFAKVSAAVAPLGKQSVLLGVHAATLDAWRGSVRSQYDAELRALLLHVGALALGVALVLVGSELWRRATLRYVHEARRRQQSLLLRRIVAALAIVLMIALSFVTELGSLATFAGFVTAGLAVALQNVILSVVAYFFLIGRYGVRVGDRVQISGIDGDVIDVGLVRLHLMELASGGLPTGRVVAFSNAVLFQPASSFFKQLPGSRFGWHQVALTLSPGTDYRSAEHRLLTAVEGVFARYRDAISRQHEDVARNLGIDVQRPRPESQLKLGEGAWR